MLGLITNGFSETQQNKIQGMNLHTYIDLMITSEEAGAMKPDRKIFEYALEKSNTKPEETLYIGDYFDTDIVGGHRAGLKTIWYNPKQTPKPDNGIIPYAEIEHLSELMSILD